MHPIQFGHPVERELAKLYDDHGIEWQYEPHTFVLEQDADGTVREAFTPDFYLPAFDIYVECTVMRQALTRRKRRKVRRARERRGVSVQILFLQDFRRLAQTWSFDGLERATADDTTFERAQNGESSRAGMRGASADPGVEGGFRIEEQRLSDTTAVLTVYGDSDFHSAPELRERLRRVIDDGATNVVLDLSETSFVDSAALGVLLGGMKRLKEHDGQIRLVVARPDIRRIFEITLLDRIFPLHDTREEALADLPGRTA